MTRVRIGLLVLALALSAAAAQAQPAPNPCGELGNAIGPFDYRGADKGVLGMVERPHFPPQVEALISGKSGTIGAELDYTLRVFPNHHRALSAVMRYGEKMKSPQPRDLRYSVECYFDRALRFRRDDQIARMLFAQFLMRQKRDADAIGQLAQVAEDAKDNAFTHYNLGLLYFDLQRYDESAKHAQQAYTLGIGRPELRERLQGVGRRLELAEAAVPAAAASGAASEPAAKPAQ
jgi:hypothetical protein